MDFALSDDQVAYQKDVRAFFEREAPAEVLAELDDSETFPHEIYAKMAAFGMTGATISAEHGGKPIDQVSLCLMAEEIARVGNNLCGAMIPTIMFGTSAIQEFGTEEQRAQILPEVASGRARIAMCLSEPGVGADLGGIESNAVRTGGDWVINGQKFYVTGAAEARYLFVLARTEPGKGARGLSALLVPTDTPGVSMQRIKKSMSRAVPIYQIDFQDVRVPLAAVIGEEGKGHRIIYGLIDGERIILGAKGVGVGQAALDIALAYSLERKQFGQPILDFQAVSQMIGDMAIEIEVARTMTHKAAWLRGEGAPHSHEAAIAKVFGSEVGTKCVARGMRVLAGRSLFSDYGLERLNRESRIYEFGGGTNEVLRELIVRSLRAGVA
jgi:alkylation response protein AidB-like acyl-CoA dehydrogenase